MGIPSFQVVHIGLKVLDYAGLVCGCNEGARMGELNGTDRAVMSLKNCFEVECEAVPEGEFS